MRSHSRLASAVARPPAGAEVLAALPGSTCLALDHGGGWLSVQFHPEATAAAMARAFGVPVEELSATEVKTRSEHINIDGVKGGVWLPTDGQADPANIALALAKGARQNGATVAERIKVTSIAKSGRRVTGVDWASDDGSAQGHIACDMIVVGCISPRTRKRPS